TSPELEHMIETLQKESLKLKIDGKMGQLKNSARIKAIRKDIARIKTELRKRQFASETVKS
ncbi:MAG TPA: 50S ribosomal protein L29, partial [Victivallales bacterium]|nr:50S ribosomal protein L29 [Victivallales bacterium]